MRAGLARGVFGFEFTGDPEQLLTKIPFPCLGDGDAEGCTGNTVTVM